ncbi:Ras GTPase activating protein [Acrasis kona]|uniref:Ras GTPase activating protein n=1 Tax=Acrasis kona TaxID=1008807 RepID=A0AAW2ZE65_9EUKA
MSVVGSPAVTGTQQLSGDIGRKYKRLVQILTSDPRYAKALADVTAPSQHEKLADSLTSLSIEIGASLSIIKALIGLEFDRKQSHPFTILRANSIVIKMMGKYTKKVGTEYLDICIGKLIKDIYAKPDLDLEVDETRVSGENAALLVEDRLKQVETICQGFVDRIMSQDMIDEMPREIRSICYFLVYNGEIYKMDFDKVILPLISGFIMLRYIGPCITVPNQWGIKVEMPAKFVRATLTLVARVLQKLSNGEQFGTETPHLMPLNTFIERNQPKLVNYLKQLLKDPLEQEGRLPFGDLQKTVTFEDIHLKSFDMKDLSFVHQMIYEYGYELIVSLQNEVIMTHDKRPLSIMSTETDFLALIQELGPPPETNKPSLSTVSRSPSEVTTTKKGKIFGDKGGKTPDESEPKKEGEAKKRDNFKNKTADEIEKSVISKSLGNLLEKIDMFDLTEFESSRFLYVGKPTRTNLPVFYLVLHRIEPHFFTFERQAHDLHLQDTQASMYRAVITFTRLMQENHLMNCQQIYLLHPTFKTMQAIEDVLNIMTSETRTKLVRTAHEWTDLNATIEASKIWIPFVSKKFVPLTYNVIKLGKNDKRKERLMKITNESILSIDPKSGIVQNEIMLQKIQEVRSRQGANEIIIKYVPETQQEIVNRGGGYFIKAGQHTDTKTHKYTCYTEQQRDIIVEAIYDAGIRSSSLVLPQTFLAQKQNKKNKKQNRMVKYTLDSILNFKDRIIKREIPYSTIQSFYLDTVNKRIMYVNFTHRGKEKCYVLEHERADVMRNALLDCIRRFKFNVQVEKDLFVVKDVDGVMDRFFAASRSKINADIDENRWKMILRIDQPCSDLKRLFKKFNPGNDGRALLSVENVRQVVVKIKLELSQDQINHLVEALDDKEKRGYITFDDLVCRWLYLKRLKVTVDKRRAVAKKRTS